MSSVLLPLPAEELFLFGEPWWRGNHKDSSDAGRQRRLSIESFWFFMYFTTHRHWKVTDFSASPSSSPEIMSGPQLTGL